MEKDFTNRTNLTDERVRYLIQRWLDSSEMAKGHRCPFQGEDECDEGATTLCGQVFPKIRKEGIPPCPCQNYTLKYVIRVAEQAIKALT